ncbi:MAG: bifunctional phosphoribosyl-AMP cyclohydrolase/phosphoribosyl-ATP diphosphatase HisIE [Lachnospiraceae bacterium]|nr:bifunctional phosphoribosyl-AMP cyclohydrolase/phosphoribosyl-ATP diphosphatase HisIE [Lachnospiraceae bacterium]
MSDYKKIIACFEIKDGAAVVEKKHGSFTYDAVELAKAYDNSGIDKMMIFERSENDAEHERNIGIIKDITRSVDCPVLLGGNIKRLEDVKKYLYAGAKYVVYDVSCDAQAALIKEGTDRFGKDTAVVYINDPAKLACVEQYINDGASIIYNDTDDAVNAPYMINCCPKNAEKMAEAFSDENCRAAVVKLKLEDVAAVFETKRALKEAKIAVNTFESSVAWADFKLNSDGLIPVIVQDYKTLEVLMMAYMNEEAFNNTLATGRMTYYSRSRQSQWVKGETSGHFQYVKSLDIDCDNDTILAKVSQVGAACHTGNRSCFFTNLAKKEYDETNPLMVFEDVYNVIMDRKLHPKEGSYTNYLFDKGIDKILKKVGEEATEIVIAAKNPDPEEIKYEISDFLYHVMVLMALKGVTWEDITKELANR